MIEDRPTPKSVYNWRVYISASMVSFAAVTIGYDSSFITTTISLPSFKEEFGLENESADELATISANIVSVYQAGSFFGCFAAYAFGFFLGRKWGLIVAGAVFCITALFQCLASHETGLGIIYAGRIILGFCVGVTSNLAPIYISEISPPAIRGRLIGLHELGGQIGAVIGFFINHGISLHIPKSNKQWLIAFAVQLIPGGVLCIASLFIKESPRWLASRGQNELALHNLAYLRNLPVDAQYVQDEYEDILVALDADRKRAGVGFFAPIIALFSSGHLMKRLIITILLFICRSGTGSHAINHYSPTIFKSIGVMDASTSLLTTGAFGIVKFLGAFFWLLLLVDHFGRRNLLLLGSVGGAIAMFYISAYIAIADPVKNVSSTLSPGNTSAMAFFYIWMCFYGVTWHGTPLVVSAEIFPQHVRPISLGFVSASNWLIMFIITRFTPQMFLSMSYGVYLFFASFMVISAFFVYTFLPETRQVPLERINELFAPGVKPWQAHGIVLSKTREENMHRGVTSTSLNAPIESLESEANTVVVGGDSV